MREYILTEHERDTIRQYVEFDRKLEGFTTLLYRTRNMQRVESDLHLIKQLLKKQAKIPTNVENNSTNAEMLFTNNAWLAHMMLQFF
jgi:hypothetical protein